MTEKNKNPSYETLPVHKDLYLQILQLDDAPKLFQLVDENRDYLRRWLPWVDSTLIVGNSRDFITSTLNDYETESSYGYGIFLHGELVGHTSLMHIQDDRDPEIGYWVAESAAGKGITTEVTRTLTAFATKTLGLNRVILCIEPENTGSNKVAENAGYILEGQQYDERAKGIVNVWAFERGGQ